MQTCLDALIISDIHLGSDNCQAKDLVVFLEQIRCGVIQTSRIILNGDVFDSFDFRRLKKNHWKVLSLIRKLSDHIDITWIHGNHDGSLEFISHLLGVNVENQYEFESGGKKILALHGHIFDEFIDKHPWLTRIADIFYCLLQKIDPSHNFAKIAKTGSKTFLRCAEKIEQGAVNLARKLGCQSVCCGHTHHAIEKINHDVKYYNSGCWTETNPTYLTVLNGEIQIQTYVPDQAEINMMALVQQEVV